MVSGEVTSSSLEHISTYLCTTKSILSISSLPFNCSQLEHVAFWHGRAGVTHTHRGHSAGSVKVQQVCSCCSVLVQFISEPWVTRAQSFHQFSSECEPHSHLWANLMWHTKDVLMLVVCMCTSVSTCVCVCETVLKKDAGFQKSTTTVIFNVSSDRDLLKGSIASGPHNEVSITATTKEMFF